MQKFRSLGRYQRFVTVFFAMRNLFVSSSSSSSSINTYTVSGFSHNGTTPLLSPTENPMLCLCGRNKS
jgi:hypothetical protein